MKRVLMAVALVGALVVVPTVGVHAAPAGAQVTIVQAATYSSAQDFPLTVCIDGTLLQADVVAGTTLDPITLTAGDHTIDFVQGSDCTASPFVTTDFTVADGDNITLMSYWGIDLRGVAVLANDESCIPAGQSRLTVRHAASEPAVNFLVTPPLGAEFAVVSNLTVSHQAQALVPAGDYSDGRFTEVVGGSLVVDLGGNELSDGEHGTVYLYGGNDGSTGYFYVSEILDTCTVPTTAAPTTTTTTTAVVATVTPRFTG